MRTLLAFFLLLMFIGFIQNQPQITSQPSLISVNRQASSSSNNQPRTVSASSSSCTPFLIKAQRRTTGSQSSSGGGQSTTVIDIVPSNPSTYSDALNAASPSQKPSPIYNQGLYNYQQANSLFQELRILKNNCLDSPSVIKNMALRLHNSTTYMTANQYFISFANSQNGPLQTQLFTAIQNPDCTWSFKSKFGRFVSLNTDLTYLVTVNSIGIKERFYMERKDGYVYVQSAISYRYYINAVNSVGLFEMNRASRFVMEVWPELDAGWN